MDDLALGVLEIYSLPTAETVKLSTVVKHQQQQREEADVLQNISTVQVFCSL